MTRKRFQKLFRSEMTKLMAHKQGAAKCIAFAATSKASGWGNDWKGKSYLEAWTILRSVYTYPGNVPLLNNSHRAGFPAHRKKGYNYGFPRRTQKNGR